MARENKPRKRDKLVDETKVSTKGKRKSKTKLSFNTASSSLQELVGFATQRRNLQNFSIGLNANRIVQEMMDKFDTWYAELKRVWIKVAQGKTWIRRKYYLTRNQYIKSRKNWRRLLHSIQYLIIHYEDLKIILVGLTCLWFENLCKGPGLLYFSIRQQHDIESPLRMLSSISRYSWGNVSIKDMFTGTPALKTERDFRKLQLALAEIQVMDMSQARTSLTNIQKDLQQLTTYRDNQYVHDELTVTDFLSQYEHEALQQLKTSLANTSIVDDLAGTLTPNAQARQQLMTKKATTRLDYLERSLSLNEQAMRNSKTFSDYSVLQSKRVEAVLNLKTLSDYSVLQSKSVEAVRNSMTLSDFSVLQSKSVEAVRNLKILSDYSVLQSKSVEADNIDSPIVAESILQNINTDINIITKLYDDGNMPPKLLCSEDVRVGEKQSTEMYARYQMQLNAILISFGKDQFVISDYKSFLFDGLQNELEPDGDRQGNDDHDILMNYLWYVDKENSQILGYITELIPNKSRRSSQRVEYMNYKNMISDYHSLIEHISKTNPEQNSEGNENMYDNSYKNEDTLSEKLFAKLQNVERQRLVGREQIQSRNIKSFPRRFTSRLLHEEDIRNYFEIGLEQTKAPGLFQQQYGLPPSVSWPLGHPMLQYKIRYIVRSMFSNAYMERLQTFLLGRNTNEKVWPDDCIVRPEPLVNAGFSYAGVQSNVVCDNCGFETNTEDWSDDDDDYAITIHRRTPKECPFLKKKT